MNDIIILLIGFFFLLLFAFTVGCQVGYWRRGIESKGLLLKIDLLQEQIKILERAKAILCKENNKLRELPYGQNYPFSETNKDN